MILILILEIKNITNLKYNNLDNIQNIIHLNLLKNDIFCIETNNSKLIII